MNSGKRPEELLKTVRTRRDKILRFDAYPDDGHPFTWFVAYRGKFGWFACRENGEWIDEPTDDDVEAAIREYENVEIMNRSDTPEQVKL
jgi:hypothetical protein